DGGRQYLLDRRMNLQNMHSHNSASTTNAPRQDTIPINKAIRGGVAALPIRADEWVIPWAKPQLCSGTPTAIARVAVGKVAPSPMPRASRAANRLASPPTVPVAGRRAHDQAADAKRETRAKFIADIATDQLEQRIRICKRRKRQAKLGIAQAEVRFDER